MGRHIRLAEANPQAIRLLSGRATAPAEGKRTSWVTVTRTGTFTDPRYGQFSITPDMLLGMVRNFDARTLGVDAFLDVNHKPGDGAAAKILRLAIEGQRLRAHVEWTDYGIDAVKSRGYQYLSAEYLEDYVDNEQGHHHGPTLLGAGLTVRPVIKRLDPVTLSCATDGVPVLIHPSFAAEIINEDKMKKHLENLRKQLAAKKLSEPIINIIIAAAEKAMELAGNDDEAAIKLCEEYAEKSGELADEIGKQLADAGNKQQITVQLSAAGTGTGTSAVKPQGDGQTKQLSEQDIAEIVTKKLAEASATAKQLTETLETRRKLLSDTIDAATDLPDDLKKDLSAAVSDLVTAQSSEEHVRVLAAAQIDSGNKIVAARKLSALGYTHQVSGTTHIAVPDEGPRQLSEIWREQMGRTSSAPRLHLDAKQQLPTFVRLVLSEFDRRNAPQIDAERRMLAEGSTNMGNVTLPVGFQREVIREALSDMNVLQLIQTRTDFSATSTTDIPYEVRGNTAHLGDGIVYEGQQIPYASVSQRMDTAYITPMKIAIEITNEVRHFSTASGLNWDAMARNVESAARVLRELIVRRICNELQRAADSYLAMTVSNESFTAQLNGATSIIKLVNFPLVRPFQARDLQGNAVGSSKNPITVVLNSAVCQPWNGSGEQPAGTYWRVVTLNLGKIQFVDQAGTPVTPANTGTNTIGYSYATNVAKVDIDVAGGSTLEKTLNKALQKFGAAKAMLNSQRYVTPDFSLMSPTLNDMLTNAEQFTYSNKRNGTDTSAQGDLETIKAVPAYGTNAPAIDLGDERILIGQRGLLGYTVAKPFAMGAPFELVENGHPVGKVASYGEEYNAMHVPEPVANRMTSLLVYSASSR